MVLLIDIGNTNTHVGWADSERILRTGRVPTTDVVAGRFPGFLGRWIKGGRCEGASLCSVVPAATGAACEAVTAACGVDCLVLGPRNLPGVGMDYPKPRTIGPDRLANAVAARHHHGAPVVAVDFGTATTVDVVDQRGKYIGGIIAPGLELMTRYLHERTALLPSVAIREPRRVVGRSTREAIRSGAVLGYRGMVGELIRELRRELRYPGVPVVATGSYAAWIASRLPEITQVHPHLTLEGLRLAWLAWRAGEGRD